MAIKRWHQQPNCTKLLSRMANSRADFVQNKNFILLYREDCRRIIKRHLFHRLQSVRLHQSKSYSPYGLHKGNVFERIYPHTGVFDESDRIRRCPECRTEYSIVNPRGNYEGSGQALSYTVWKDLGPDPESDIWKQHLPDPDDSKYTFWKAREINHPLNQIHNQMI
ncbi:uncharacterized protein RAG0_06516 [Rhynchosporium agropyri]|uniref:Uncharacterized protein n=1 Tax=Rhynchosporium agropyri TaxID=914238 RepID=A0A1E1KHG7_9HELO|nr:uncharacterized protein RAG0_06516 [Rhynchosporium agropyri]